MRHLILLASAACIVVLPLSSAIAQTANTASVEQRVDRIERELRAVQRRVFPGSDGRVLQPEVQPADIATPAEIGSMTPSAEVTARIDALEAQLTRLTEQVEQTSFRQRELDTSISRLRAELTARIDRMTAGDTDTVPAVTGASAPVPRAPATAAALPSPASLPAAAPVSGTRAAPTPAPRPGGTPARTPPAPAIGATPAPAAANAARRAQVAAIDVPSTGNPVEDTYLYGYRLWEARLYPEAQTQLQRVLADHPTDRRASYAGNLLGRAYLDNNQPNLAVGVLYDNYRNRPRGERAPHSIYYMGMALIALDRRPDACRTFGEIDRVYGDAAPAELRAQVVRAREQARC